MKIIKKTLFSNVIVYFLHIFFYFRAPKEISIKNFFYIHISNKNDLKIWKRIYTQKLAFTMQYNWI